MNTARVWYRSGGGCIIEGSDQSLTVSSFEGKTLCSRPANADDLKELESLEEKT